MRGFSWSIRAVGAPDRPRSTYGVTEHLTESPPFRAELARPTGDIAVVALSGEVDLYTAPEFHETLLRGVADGARRIVVDLSAVTFLDSTALGVLVGGAQRLPDDGALLIVCGDDRLRRTLEIVGLDRVFAVHPTLEEALAAAR